MSTKHKRRFKYLAFIVAPLLLIALMLIPALSVGQTTVPPEFSTCTDCHNDTTLITGKQTAWAASLHGNGEAYLRGTSKSCAGCHSGGGFSAMVAAGKEPNTVTAGDPNPTRQDCRTCHQIHTTYTGVDFALETTAPVNLFALTGKTFDGGEGNLCAKCHQPRTKPPVATNGVITGISSHWGPHHGPQSSMMLGTGGAGLEGTAAGHYTSVQNTCVGCHLGANDDHSFTPNVTVCQGCHTGATSFDINGKRTEIQGKADQLKSLLINAGLLGCTVDAEGVEDCSPIVTQAPENQGKALFNWIYVVKEDKSMGVHNPGYTTALLDASIALLPCDGPPTLALGSPQPFWGSYADYLARLLSVTYTVSNSGTTGAFSVNMTNSSATNGVTLASTLPASLGNIAAGASAPITFQYNVPPGVTAFRINNGAAASDNCGTNYTYGTQPNTP